MTSNGIMTKTETPNQPQGSDLLRVQQEVRTSNGERNAVQHTIPNVKPCEQAQW